VEVGILFVNNRTIREYNRQYRGKDVPTDVLSFPMGPNDSVKTLATGEGSCPPYLLGDLIISPERAEAEAALFSRSYSEQMLFLLVHGLLHLLGHDHETSRRDETRMQRHERRLLAGVAPLATKRKYIHTQKG
jgi:probable rRNA maturation factor